MFGVDVLDFRLCLLTSAERGSASHAIHCVLYFCDNAWLFCGSRRRRTLRACAALCRWRTLSTTLRLVASAHHNH